MDKKYITLFKNLAQTTAASAEAVMDYDREKGDEKGLEAATTMRNDFQALTDAINSAQDEYQMNRIDAARLLIAATIQVNQLQSRMNNLKQAIAGYQSDVIPKLQEIMDTENDDDVAALANEKFMISES